MLSHQIVPKSPKPLQMVFQRSKKILNKRQDILQSWIIKNGSNLHQ